jgi:hypothetical protein
MSKFSRPATDWFSLWVPWSKMEDPVPRTRPDALQLLKRNLSLREATNR